MSFRSFSVAQDAPDKTDAKAKDAPAVAAPAKTSASAPAPTPAKPAATSAQ